MVFDFKSILDLVKAFPDQATCMAYLEEMRWNGNVVSPFDETSKVYKCAGNRYQCKNTNKYFNAKVGTIFEDTKIPLIKWYMALYLFSSHKKGISSHQLAKDITVTQKTAWFMLHRLRFAFDSSGFHQALENTVEVDETYIGGKSKNKHNSKKTEGTQGRSTKDKTPVLGMIERDGKVIAKVVTDTKQATIEPVINEFIVKGSDVMTDEWHAYNNLNKSYNHAKVHHGAKEYVNGMVHTNGIENFWSHLKRGIDGIYHWVSPIHLQRYVNEFSLRFNTRKYSTSGRFDLVLSNVKGRLTYKELTK